jgi:hypothetical protein
MNISIDPIAVYAAIVATGALFLEVRRWFENGPRLALGAMPNAQMSGDETKEHYLILNVANVGNLPTTLGVMVLIDYGNWFRRLASKPKWQFLVPKPDLPGVPSQSKFLEPGQTWVGAAWHSKNEDLVSRINTGHFFVGITASHKKHANLVHVRPIKDYKATSA